MELFSLLAKLTLDSKEYDKGIDEAEKKGNFTIEDAKLGLDKSDFDSGVSEAENTHVDDIDVDMELDTTDFESNIEAAKDKSQEYTDSIGGMFKDLKGILIGAGIIGILSKINGFISEGINLTSKHADTIDKQSHSMGVSTKAYQVWDYALNRSGSSVDELRRGMITFHKVLGDTSWMQSTQQLEDWGNDFAEEQEESLELSKDQAEAFEKLGLKAKIMSGEITNSEQLANEAIMALANVDDETTRNKWAEAIFGKNSVGIKNLVAYGQDTVKELFKNPVELGLVMSDEEIQHGVEYTDTMYDLNMEMNALKEVFVKDILPVLTNALKIITSILAFFNPRADKNSLADLLEGVDKDFAKTIRNVDSMEGEAMSLIDQLASMGEYTKLTADQQLLWNQRAERAKELFPELGNVIDDDAHKINGNTAEIKENIKQWGNLLRKRALMQAVADKEQILADKAADAADKEIEAETKLDEAAGKRYAAMMEGNRILEENEMIRGYFEQNYGKGARLSLDDPDEKYGYLMMLGRTAEHHTESQPSWTKSFDDIYTQYGQLKEEAKELTETAETANKEVEEEREHLERYTQIAAQKYGIMTDEAELAVGRTKELSQILADLPKTVFIDIQIPDIAGIFSNAVTAAGGYQQAIGDPYVPYDNYPSLLHRGEMVLTATEARKYREGGGDSSDLEDRIIDAIQRGMSNAHVDAFMDGEKVTRSVSNRLARENGARRYNP